MRNVALHQNSKWHRTKQGAALVASTAESPDYLPPRGIA